MMHESNHPARPVDCIAFGKNRLTEYISIGQLWLILLAAYSTSAVG